MQLNATSLKPFVREGATCAPSPPHSSSLISPLLSPNLFDQRTLALASLHNWTTLIFLPHRHHKATTMSGGVGSINDISLPKDDRRPPTTPPSSATTKRGFLSFRHLNSLAVVVVLAASGLVGFQDLAFLVLSLVYIYVLSVVAFPSLGPAREPTVFDPRHRVLRLYVSFAAVVGLFLPIAYIFEGIYEGDKEGIAAAAPHLFLLASQVFMEGVAFSARFSTPIRVFVPVSYNARRIFTLMEWLGSEFAKVGGDGGGSARRVYAGRILAAANMALWCFNLFAFLLPVYMPRAFKMYYAAYYNVKDV